jgi:hypothetical protein
MRRIASLLVLTLGFVVSVGMTTADAQVTSVQADISGATLLDRTHVLVEGEIICDAPADTADIDFILLRQRGGGGFREGLAFPEQEDPSCGPTPTSFTAVVTGGPFHRGPVIYDIFVVVCNDSCAGDYSFGIVRIR